MSDPDGPGGPVTPEQLMGFHRLIPLDELAHLPGNPNQGDEASLSSSLDEFGWMDGIVVCAGTVIAGNHRVDLARARGLTHLPGYDLTPLGMSAAQQMAAALTLNRTGRAGLDDPALLNRALTLIGDRAGTIAALPAALAVPPDVEAQPVGQTTTQAQGGFVGSDTRQLILAYPVEEHAELARLAGELDGSVPMSVLVARLLEVEAQ